MRTFNVREKEILSEILSAEPHGTVLLDKLLEKSFFSEEKGRALILQTVDRYVIFYMRPEVFDDAQTKNEEIAEFFELVSLINYLKYRCYISLYVSESIKEKSIYFMSSSFVNPRANSDKIVLNDRGDYTSNPECILNKNGEVIYKGVRFDSDVYDMIASSLRGLLYVFPALKDFMNTSGLERERDSKMINKKYWFVGVGIFLGLFLCACCLFFMIRLGQYEKMINGLIASKEDMYKELINISLKIKNLDSVVLSRNKQMDEKISCDTKKVLYGIDISKYNGDIIEEIDEADSLTFIICKATEGICYIDPDFRTNWELIQKKGMLKGAYHFYHTHEDPAKQAEHFWYTMKGMDSPDIAPIVDIEQSSIPSNIKIDVSKLQNDLLKFLSYVERKMNRIPMIYTGEAFANKYLVKKDFAQYPLWLAEYNSKEYPVIPKTWDVVGFKIWQKSDSYDIKSNRSDFDIFYGAKSDLVK